VPKVPLQENRRVRKDYDKFFATWEGKIRHIVVRSGSFPRQEVDDVVQELLLSLYEKDYLTRYDSSKNVKFSTFVQNFVRSSILGKRDRLHRHLWREGISLEAFLENEDEEDIVWMEELLRSPEQISPEFISLVVSIYHKLKETPVTSSSNNFPGLFKSIVQQVIYGNPSECVKALGETVTRRTGRFGLNRKVLAYELGISESAVSIMLRDFRKLAPVRELLSS
jgi:DNA-directed RNA polymerase specialized sigma24 family protein